VGVHNQIEVYGQTLLELGRENKNIVLIESDTGKSTMFSLFREEFPKRYFEIDIAEGNMISFASGLSLAGNIVFTDALTVFASGCPFYEFRQGICMGRLNLKIVGSSTGLSDFGGGTTHQFIEDLAIMRAIPNMTVIALCDGTETRKAVRVISEYKGPVYMRLSRNDLDDVFSEDQEFRIGKPVMLRDGTDIAVFCMGTLVSPALKAAAELEEEGISVRVVNVSTLKPIDENSIVLLASGMKGVITAEEHSYIGGLASTISYALRNTSVPFEAVAIDDIIGQPVESHEKPFDYYGLNSESIIQKARFLTGRGYGNMDNPYYLM
jgi:transketolase